MTADTLKTTRVLELYQDFLSGKLINKQQAAEQYHVNVRSIQRDIDSIRDFLSEQCAKEGIVRKIEYDKKENGYRLVTQEIEQLSKGEVLALCKILLESRAFTKEQVKKQLQIILNLCVSQKEKSDIEWFISNELFHYHDPAHATVDPDNLWMVAQAIRNQSVLEIEYVLTGSAQKNRLRGREDAAAQQEKTRDLLDDRIRGKDGTESTPLTKKQDDDLSKTIKKDENGNAYVDNEAMDKVMEDTGIKGKVKNAIRKNEIQGLASAVAIGAGIGFTIGFAVSLAQSGITPDSVKYAFVNGGKSGVASGVQSVVGYGIGRTIGQIATNAIEGVLSNAGLEITANISKMCTMGTVGAITVAVFSTVQFVKLIYHGECLKSAAIQVGKQALFSLSLLAISIAAQGMWGGPAGIIVSIGTGIVIVSYTIADAVHQRTFAEECHIKTIEEYGRLALRHLNELQFA